MALKRNETYPGRFSNPTDDHPQGAFKNRSAPGAQDGSYLEQQWANDWDGFFGRLLTLAEISPNGNVDTASSSQYYDALKSLFLQRTDPFGDIKSDGAEAVSTALENIGLGTGLTGIVGQSRNAAMRITAASSTATWTADELVVETAIGGTQYRLNNLSLSINLATTGAGGMDTGAAPASGFVAIYAIYNPTTKTTAALAVNATSAKAPEVYGGSNMPAGYTASALIAVCGTNSSGQLLPGLLTDRTWMTPRTIVLNVTVQNSSWTSMTLAAMVPLNAKRVMGDLAGATNSGNITMGGSGDSTNAIGASWPTYYLIGQCPFDIELSSPQTMYYLNTMTSGSTISFQVFVKGYVF